MTQEEIIRHSDEVITNSYTRIPRVLVKGEGCVVYDKDHNAYLDFIAGIAVCCLGHAHPAISKAIYEQSQKLIHVSNLYYTEPQVQLAQWLVEHSFADKVFFGNSGAEANEAAIKIARKYFYDNNTPEKNRIIAMKQSFHGRTMTTLSATGQDKVKKGFSPIAEGFDFVEYNNIDALLAMIGSTTAAVLMEPIQGEGGVLIPDIEYIQKVRQICDEKGLLLIFDEIQTGIGRTGKWFAYEHFGVKPDIMSLAKAIGNGLPIGVMLTTNKVATAFDPGSHGSTFGGAPLVTTAALVTLQTLERENWIEHSQKMGKYFKERLLELKNQYSCVIDVRGIGLILALELKDNASQIVNSCLEKGFLINSIQNKILRFVPPLIITQKQIDLLISCLSEVFARQK